MIGRRLRAVTGAFGLAAALALGGCTQIGGLPHPVGGAPPTDAGGSAPPVVRVPVDGAGYPVSITLSPDGGRAYIVGTDGLAVLDTVSRAVVATVPQPGSSGYRGAAVSPDGTRVYLPTSAGVAVLDAATNAVVSTLPVDDHGLTDVAVSPDGARLYVASSSTGVVAALDTGSGAVQATAQVDRYVETRRLVLSPDGRALRVTTSAGLVELDTATLGVVSTAQVADQGSIVGLTESPDGARVYVSSVVDRISIVEGGRRTGEVVIPNHSPGGVAVSPDGSLLFAGGYGMGGALCSVVDTGTATVAATFDLGHQSEDVAFAPDADVVYAIDYNHGLSVVDLRGF